MKKLITNLYVGNDADCLSASPDFAIIHACKTCHQKGVGYRGNLASTNPCYLIYDNSSNLFLNLVDMDRKFLPKYTHPIMKSALTFIKNNIEIKKILIHCNLGQSRSPTICLVYLALNGNISNMSYQQAKIEFIRFYPIYQPGSGFERYLNKNWEEVLSL